MFQENCYYLVPPLKVDQKSFSLGLTICIQTSGIINMNLVLGIAQVSKILLVGSMTALQILKNFMKGCPDSFLEGLKKTF